MAEILSTRLKHSATFVQDLRAFVALGAEDLQKLKDAAGKPSDEIDEEEVLQVAKVLGVVRGTAIQHIYTLNFLAGRLAEENQPAELLLDEVQKLIGAKLDPDTLHTLERILSPTQEEANAAQERAAFAFGNTYLSSNFRLIFAPGSADGKDSLHAGYMWILHYQKPPAETESLSISASVGELRELAKRLNEICDQADNKLANLMGKPHG